MRELFIGDRRIADNTECWTIAELGHNHGGNYETCALMIEAAHQAGASAVKLQKRDNKALYTDEAYSRPYESENSYGDTYGAHREALEFGEEDYRFLKTISSDVAMPLFATPFDRASVDFLAKALNPPCFKIASSDIVNLDLIEYVAHQGRPMILSTGAASQHDVDRAVDLSWAINQYNVALLQCSASYPARPESLNLNVITTYRERYPEMVIGYSSHYSGISDAVVAYTLGARIIEKHFTLDRTSKGSDHAFSLEPSGFAKMVSYLHKARGMLGSKDKVVLPEEQGMIDKMRATTRWYTEVKDAVH